MSVRGGWQGNRRDSNEAEIVTALQAVGAHVYRMHTPVDLLIRFRGHTYLQEVKAPGRKKRLQPSQVQCLNDWGDDAAVVESVEEALEHIGAIIVPT